MSVIKSVLVEEDSFVMNYPSARPSVSIGVETESLKATPYASDDTSSEVLLDGVVTEIQGNAPAPLLESNDNMLIEHRAEAYQDGYNEGLRAATEDFQYLLDQLSELVKDASNSLLKLSSESEKLISLIVFEAVSKILGHHLFVQQDSLDIVRKIVSEYDTGDILVIKVSERDYKALKDANDLLGIPLTDLLVEIDRSNKLGGARVELKSAYVDATLETQLHNFTQLLKDIK